MSEEPAPGAPAQPATPADPSTPNEPFYSSFQNAELKGYVENRGFKSVEAMAESLQNLHKLHGAPAEQLLRLPEDMSADGAMNAVWDKLGRPESAASYTNKLGENFVDDAYKQFTDVAHKAGLTDAQFGVMQDTLNAVATAQTEAIDAAFDDWSKANPAALTSAKNMFTKLGMNAETVDAMLTGDKAALFQFVADVADRTGEAAMVDGDNPNTFDTPQDPAAIEAQIKALRAEHADPKTGRVPPSINDKIRALYVKKGQAMDAQMNKAFATPTPGMAIAG